MRQPSPRVSRLALLLILLPLAGLGPSLGCGGSGADAEEPPPLQLLQFETDHATLSIDAEGRLAELRLHGSGKDVASGEPQPILELVHDGATLPLTALRSEAGRLVATFGADVGRAELAVDEQPGHLLFRVLAVEPSDVEALRLLFTVKSLGTRDAPLNGTYGDEDILCLRPTKATGRCDHASVHGLPRLGVAWGRRHGIVGGEAALVATPRSAFFDVVGALEQSEGLPSPRYDGVPARLSAAARKGYLFLTYYRPGDLSALLEYAKLGGFRSILILRQLWRESEGTYGIAPEAFPGGLADLEAFADQVHAAGLEVGLHLYGPSVSVEDPLVTPVPQDGLLSWDGSSLALAIGAQDDELPLAGEPSLPDAGSGGFPGTYLRLGDEIVRYDARTTGAPWRFTGCERGALGTTATPHAAGTPVRHLATEQGQFLVDPDGPMALELSRNLARVVNAADVDMVYFDGAPSTLAEGHFESWYYLNRLLPACDQAFDHTVLVQTSRGPGRQLDWHLVPRSASADGHGDIKYYLDLRTPSIESIRRGFTVPDVGWYGFDAGRPPDYLEYIAARCLGWDCPISIQSHRIAMEADPRARETIELVGRYERCKEAATLPQAVRDALLVQGKDFRVLEDDEAGWHVFEASYEPVRDVRTLTGQAYSWSVVNPDAEPRALGVEIVRGEAIRADADWSAPGTAYLDLFHDVTPYVPSAENDSARLVQRVGKVLTEAGAAREGVQHGFSIVQDSRVGGPCAALEASNTGNVLGWCSVGRRFDPLLDISSMSALGIWVYGEKSGVTVTLELWDDQDRRAVMRVPVFFDGWRLHTFPLVTPAAFDRARVKYLVLVVSDLAPGLDAEVRLVALRGTPTVRSEVDLTGVRLRIGEREIDLPVALPPGSTARIDALGRLTVWPGGMGAGQSWPLTEGPVTVDPGPHSLGLEVTGSDPFPGDVSIRVSRLRRLHPE